MHLRVKNLQSVGNLLIDISPGKTKNGLNIWCKLK